MSDRRDKLEMVAEEMGATLAEYVTIWSCQGPPRCDLQGDEAVAAQEAGCRFCKQIRVADDGTELTIEPGTA